MSIRASGAGLGTCWMGDPYLTGGKPGLGIGGPCADPPRLGFDCTKEFHSLLLSVGVGVGALLP